MGRYAVEMWQRAQTEYDADPNPTQTPMKKSLRKKGDDDLQQKVKRGY